MRIHRILIFFIGLLVLAEPAAADKRVALVIGNGAYTKVPKLDNPKNDAAAMEAMFKAAGFDIVVRVNDLGAAAMRRALRDFSDAAQDADIAVVFYAGHGMEVSGTNYLIPTDAVLERDIDVQDEAISLDRVSQMLEAAKRLRLVILDACRDNPFVRSMRRTIATRTVRSGYGEIDEKSLPPNTLVAYAQRAGATAEDGAGSNSPYTTALLKHLPTPGLDIELALRRVRDDVLKTTRNRQEPYKYGSLGGSELALVSGGGSLAATAATKEKPAIQSTPSTQSDAAREWAGVDKTSVAELETFIARHGGSPEAAYARARQDILKRKNDEEAERQRLAAVKRQGTGPSHVVEGVFDLSEGQIMDLTDRRVLLTLRTGQRCVELVINGRGACAQTGKRVDLKWPHAPFYLGQQFADKQSCLLDVINVQAQKGAKAAATFRLSCI